MKVIIVTGGREYSDRDKVRSTLEFLRPNVIVQGGAAGADRLALQWAADNIVDRVTLEADWETHGKAAGPIRNVKMLDKYPEATVVAFPGGRGTEHTVQEALKRGMLVLRVQ